MATTEGRELSPTSKTGNPATLSNDDISDLFRGEDSSTKLSSTDNVFAEDDVAHAFIEQQIADDMGFVGKMPGSFDSDAEVAPLTKPKTVQERAEMIKAAYAGRQEKLAEHLFSPTDSQKSVSPKNASRESQKAEEQEENLYSATSESPGSAVSGSSPVARAFPKQLRPLSSNRVTLEIQVKLRLLPAAVLLSRQPSDSATLLKAKEHARAAWRLADTGLETNHPLVSRCCFYIGVCRYMLHEIRGRAKVGGRDALSWFLNAVDAKDGGFEEGRLAEVWIEFLKGPQMSPSAHKRPSTAQSWVDTIWERVRSFAEGGQRPMPQDVGSSVSPKHLAGEAQQGWKPRPGEEAVPDYESERSVTYDHHGLAWSRNHPYGKDTIMCASPGKMTGYTDESDDPPVSKMPLRSLRGGLVDIAALGPPRTNGSNDRVALGGLRIINSGLSPTSPEEEIPVQAPAPLRYKIVNPDPTNSSSSADTRRGGEAQPDAPELSPSKRQASSPRKSVAFSHSQKDDDDAEEENASTSPVKAGSIWARRRISNVLGITTGHSVEQLDNLMMAEEGRSPGPDEEGFHHRKKNKTP